MLNRRNYLKTQLAGAGALTGLELIGGLQTQAAHVPSARNFPLGIGQDAPLEELRQLGGYIEAYTPPIEPLPAAGGWTAVYDILNFSAPPKQKAGKSPMANASMGQVAISKSGTGYKIEAILEPTPEPEYVGAHIQCNADDIGSIRNYELTWRYEPKRPPRLAYTKREAGSVSENQLTVSSGELVERFQLTAPLTTLWTLMDQVRWLPSTTDWQKEFDLYMDLSSLRRRQTLTFRRTATVLTAAGPVNLHIYEQLGEGIEPIHYAVDDINRTLFVTHGQLGWGLRSIQEGCA